MATENKDPGKKHSYTSVTEITAQRKRKSSGIFQSLKFWKKEKNSTRSPPQISKPMQFQHLNGTSSRPVGATLEERYQKSVSLPQVVTRDSALRSHAPLDALPLEKQVESDIEPPRRILHRRVTLPKLTGADDEYPHIDRRQSILDDGQMIDPADIGFAVTSGSNFLKRRSRSAGALHAISQIQTRPSPMPLRQERRRSDEIRYWRASITPATNGLEHVFSQDHAQVATTNPTQEETRLPETRPISHNVSGPEDNNPILEQTVDTGKNFDFGGLKVTVDEAAQNSVEERVVALEGKLIDVEYSISKLQSSSTIGRSESSTYMQNMLGHDSTTLSHQSQLNSDAATNHSVSTQPTTVSLFSTSDELATQSKLHIDVENTSRAPIRVSNLIDSYKRNSLDTLTIDHLNSLIGLIRREQAARHRLEDQIVELQREFKSLRLQLLPPSIPGTPYTTHGGWKHAQHSRIFDDSETDDGFQEIYETPTEFTGRGIYEGGVSVGQGEGIAF